jgi:cytochrome c-type biogenesis protein CcmE
MRRDRRFFAGLIGVTGVVSWLVWTGISDTMVYYLTPSELLARAESEDRRLERGVKVSGNVVPGSVGTASDELLHTFRVVDPMEAGVELTVLFRHPLPDTFTEEAEVVMEGRYLGDGMFEATEVLTKCGSRYEAMPEEGDYVTTTASASGTSPSTSSEDPSADVEADVNLQP